MMVTAVDVGVAREIMGSNVITVEEVRKQFGSFEEFRIEIKDSAEVPFSAQDLEECRETHLLVPGFQLSLLDLAQLKPKLFAERQFMNVHNPFGPVQTVKISRTRFWRSDFPFLAQKVETRWYLIRKGIMPGSRSKTYPEQLRLLTEKERVPTASEITYVAVLAQLTRGEQLFFNVMVRGRDRMPVTNFVVTIEQRNDGLTVGWAGKEEGHNICGIASEQMPDDMT